MSDWFIWNFAEYFGKPTLKANDIVFNCYLVRECNVPVDVAFDIFWLFLLTGTAISWDGWGVWNQQLGRRRIWIPFKKKTTSKYTVIFFYQIEISVMGLSNICSVDTINPLTPGSETYLIYLCISQPFMASKEAPKIAFDLYTGQRFSLRAKFQLHNLFKINIIMLSWT